MIFGQSFDISLELWNSVRSC